MTTSFKVKDYEDGKLIRLSAPLNNRKRILDFIYASMFFIGTVGFTLLFISNWGDSFMAGLIAFLCIVAFSIAFYRFINKATETEKIFINKEKLEIISSALLKTHHKSYLLKDISNFKFLEIERYESHPLKGETFDYLGFQTEQQVIQDLHSDGRISFVYKGLQVKFAKEITSWEFNELEVLLYELTGNDFRYTDDFERENFPR